MSKPNFFIVGAQKCGTTAMYSYLDQHPQIFMSPVKEPHFFGSDFTDTRLARYRNSLNEYLALFDGVTTEKAIGEASPSYLLSTVAAQEIHEFSPNAHIIIMLRSPIDMIYSMYHQSHFMGDEPSDTFREAIEPELDHGWDAHTNRTYSYLEVAHNSVLVKRYLKTFPREQIKIILFDDFKQDVATVYSETLAFLGVDPDFAADFTIVNASKQVRSKALQDTLEKLHLTPSHVRDSAWFLALSKLMPESAVRWLVETGKAAYAKEARYPKMPDDLRDRLLDYFQPEISQLSKIINRDLSHWLDAEQKISAKE